MRKVQLKGKEVGRGIARCATRRGKTGTFASRRGPRQRLIYRRHWRWRPGVKGRGPGSIPRYNHHATQVPRGASHPLREEQGAKAHRGGWGIYVTTAPYLAWPRARHCSPGVPSRLRYHWAGQCKNCRSPTTPSLDFVPMGFLLGPISQDPRQRIGTFL